MLQKILIALGVVIGIIILWFGIQYLWNATQGDVTRVYKTDFIQRVTQHVTSGIPNNDFTSPAEVTLEELGEISPVNGMVEIIRDSSTMKDPEDQDEYIEIRARVDNAEPINISNWSIQSMVSDTWIGIPQAAELYIAGDVNELQDVYLRPGESAIISSRTSPVGVSFRVNRCSGFLENFQSFTPRIRTQCIDPRDVAPPTIESLKEYGDACVAFAEDLPRCTYVTADIEGFATLSAECLARLQPTLTYNYCANRHNSDVDFYSANEWRLFLNQDRDLWRENYEIVRLLDEHNRTVDVFNY